MKTMVFFHAISSIFYLVKLLTLQAKGSNIHNAALQIC